MKVELHRSNYVFNRNNKCWYIKFRVKLDLESSKSWIDKIDVDKLKTVPNNLRKPSNVVDVVKKTVYGQLFTKAIAVDTKVPSTTELVFKTSWFQKTKSC